MDDEAPPVNDNEAPVEVETNVLSFDEQKRKRRPNSQISQPRPPQNPSEALQMENVLLKKKLAEMTFDRIVSGLITSFVNNGVPLSSERKDMSKLLKLCFDSVEGVIRKYYRLPSEMDVVADTFYSLTDEGTVVSRFGPRKEE